MEANLQNVAQDNFEQRGEALDQGARMDAHVVPDTFGSVRPHASDDFMAGGGQEGATSTVFVVDGDAFVRASLMRLIRAAGWQPETFSSAEEFLSGPRDSAPCCLVLDVTLPGLSGLDLQKALTARTEMPVIFVSSRGDVPTTVQAMKAGAVDFLTKPFNETPLVHAIEVAIERSRAALRLDWEMRALKTSYTSLSARERAVMSLVVSGLLNKQVGGELGISEVTVKAHRGQVMRKMKADSLPDLVTMAGRLGIGSGPKHRLAMSVQ